MILKVLNEEFSVCKVTDYSGTDLTDLFCFIGKTDEECSLVCLTQKVPANVVERDDGWRGFRIQGVLDFSLIGILSRISDVLAKNGVGIFAVSTFNTDYIFMKKDQLEKGIKALKAEGYQFV